MSALLKGGAGLARSLSFDGTAIQPLGVTQDPWQAERVALSGEIDRLRQALDEARGIAVTARADAYAEGEQAGRREAADREEERLSLLARALDQAGEVLSSRLERLDELAPALAKAAIGKLFDGRESWSDAVEGAIRRQLRTLRASAVVAIHVSPLDFSDLDGLRGARLGQVHIAIDSGLRAGACRIECKLGQIDLDVREQWGELAALLDGMRIEQ